AAGDAVEVADLPGVRVVDRVEEELTDASQSLEAVQAVAVERDVEAIRIVLHAGGYSWPCATRSATSLLGRAGAPAPSRCASGWRNVRVHRQRSCSRRCSSPPASGVWWRAGRAPSSSSPTSTATRPRPTVAP